MKGGDPTPNPRDNLVQKKANGDYDVKSVAGPAQTDQISR